MSAILQLMLTLVKYVMYDLVENHSSLRRLCW